jgi:hypothetical protein
MPGSTALIQDAGLTEFGGVPTYTALAIGPDEDAKIDELTKIFRCYESGATINPGLERLSHHDRLPCAQSQARRGQ